MNPGNLHTTLGSGSIAAVICAAGSSSRMGGNKKEYLPLPGGFGGELRPTNREPHFAASPGRQQSVLAAAAAAFASCPEIGPIVITVPPGGESAARACLPSRLLEEERILFVQGGPTRRASVHNALLFLYARHPSHVLIHDGARPWIKKSLIEKIIEAAIRYGAAIPALPLLETPKELESGALLDSGEKPAFIKRHLKREGLCAAQTPQGFAFSEILKAHEEAGKKEKNEGFVYTDDAEVWGEFIGQVAVIPGDPENKKITYPEDLEG